QPPIKAGHQSNFRVSERRHYSGQVIWWNGNVRIVHYDVLMRRDLQHLNQVADFDIGTQFFFTNNRLDPRAWELLLELFDHFQRRIIGLADAKNDFVLAIVRQAMSPESLIHARIDAL